MWVTIRGCFRCFPCTAIGPPDQLWESYLEHVSISRLILLCKCIEIRYRYRIHLKKRRKTLYVWIDLDINAVNTYQLLVVSVLGPGVAPSGGETQQVQWGVLGLVEAWWRTSHQLQASDPDPGKEVVEPLRSCTLKLRRHGFSMIFHTMFAMFHGVYFGLFEIGPPNFIPRSFL